MDALEIMAFGIFTTEFSKVLILVLRKVISSTVPSKASTCIQSPTIKGLSKKTTTPANRFFAVSCAAKVKITPPIPKPATKPFRLTPKAVIMINPAMM